MVLNPFSLKFPAHGQYSKKIQSILMYTGGGFPGGPVA